MRENKHGLKCVWRVLRISVPLLVHIGLRVPLIIHVIVLAAVVVPFVVVAGIVISVVKPPLPTFPKCVCAVVWRALLASVVAVAL